MRNEFLGTEVLNGKTMFCCTYVHTHTHFYIYIYAKPPPPHELPRGAAIPSPILLRVGFWCMIQF